MKVWTPQLLYDAKPWVFIGLGAFGCLGTILWAVLSSEWTWIRAALCLGGAALGILGGAILQTRREYRSRSKWRREHLR